MRQDFYVYLHKRASDDVVYYVGKGHGKRAFKFGQKDRNKLWIKIHKKHGTNVEIIRSNLSEMEAFDLEISTIKMFRHAGIFLANMTDGGDGVTDSTGDVGAKISAKLKGVKKSQEHAKKCADARRGSKDTEETRRKKSESAKGRVFSEEHRANLSKSNKGPRTEKQLAACSKGGKIAISKMTKDDRSKYAKEFHSRSDIKEKVRYNAIKNWDVKKEKMLSVANSLEARIKNAEAQRLRKRIADELRINYHSVTKDVIVLYKSKQLEILS